MANASSGRSRKRPPLEDYSITYEQARLITSGLRAMNLGESEDDVGTVLVLLRALTYSNDRESLLCACEEALLPLTLVAERALDDLIDRRREAIRRL